MLTQNRGLNSEMLELRKKTELLLPVGQKEMVLAAIHNGADAIFLGFPSFNARGRSYDFSIEELKEIIELCHLYGVRVNIALNIVIFENELTDVVEALKKVIPLNPDSFIIQDLGLIQIIRALAPQQAIHASTQMTITNDLAIKLLSDLNIKRFVLGRENSLSEIKLIKQNTDKELEVFVHGALCVSYSGQCFTSETLGGRSANRGQCAQSCRFEYDLIVDGERKNQFGRDYLVSPQDLCGIAEIPELMDIGVESFKVEGRLKTPEYVASVASSFNQAIEKHLLKKNLSEDELIKLKSQMALQYSRGFFTGWLHGVDHQRLVNGTYNAHRGILLGDIVEVLAQNQIVIKIQKDTLNKLNLTLKPGDGLSWDVDGEFKGSFIYSVEKMKHNRSWGNTVDQFDFYKIGIDQKTKIDLKGVTLRVFYNHDKDLKKELESSYQDKNHFKKLPLQYLVEFNLKQKVKVIVKHDVFTLEYETESLVVEAQKSPIADSRIVDELASLSATVYYVESFTINSDQNSKFIPMAEIKKIRQQLTVDLNILRIRHFGLNKKGEKLSSKTCRELINKPQESLLVNTTYELPVVNQLQTESKIASDLQMHLLLRNKEQVFDLVKLLQENKSSAKDWFTQFVKEITLDFEFGLDFSPSLEALNELKKQGLKIGLATTRILKPQEYNNLKILKNLNPDYILVRNLGALYYYSEVNKFGGYLKGDFSLNVSNSLSFNYLQNKGLNTICLSYDANFMQIQKMLAGINGEQAEITLHQTMPSFHMEHCVFAAFLSQGSSYRDCGKPCEKHKVQLKDQFGHSHWIKPDQECRNTMFNAMAQTALPYLQDWKQKGLKHVRFEALQESAQDILNKLEVYYLFSQNRLNLNEAMSRLNVQESYGLSTGNLSRETEYQSRKKDHAFLRE